jgi:hypothetical protein
MAGVSCVFWWTGDSCAYRQITADAFLAMLSARRFGSPRISTWPEFRHVRHRAPGSGERSDFRPITIATPVIIISGDNRFG